MSKEQLFYQTLKDIFIGATIEGKGGYINLMRIKSKYYEKIKITLDNDIHLATLGNPSFKEELFDKLYTFFKRYFSENGSIYFHDTPFHNNVYEKIYTPNKDIILFWKTQMLYYVKSERIFRSIPIEFDNLKFYFDASQIEHKKANEKKSLIYELKEIDYENTIHFTVLYSEKGRVTKTDDILKAIKKAKILITEEQLENAFRIFEKQSEVDFFIHKNAKAFLQEQFKLWTYQYFWEGAKEWSAERVNQLQILKNIAFKIIDFVSQFEDELVKIWNKPKFVKNSNYVITLDRIANKTNGFQVLDKIINHQGLDAQIQEWRELNIVNENFTVEDFIETLFPNHYQPKPILFDKDTLKERNLITNGYHLPYNPNLIEKARELRKNMTAAEKKLWYEFLKNYKYRVLRQRPIDNFIADFYCPALKLVIEIDGESHSTEEAKQYDEQRTQILEQYGLKVIRFTNDEVLNHFDTVCGVLSPLSPPLLRGDARGDTPPYPIDTKYFKDLEHEILSLFENLDNELNGWLIKSENYQALNTILPKFKEKVQTIYIDPPFNLDSSDQFLYRTNYKDANWATLLENRLRIAKNSLNEKGSIFVRCDYNGNWIVRCLMDEIFDNNYKNEIVLSKSAKLTEKINKYHNAHDTLYFYTKSDEYDFEPATKRREKPEWRSMHLPGIRWSPIPNEFVKIFSKENLKEKNGKFVTRARIILGKELLPPEGRHWALNQESIFELEKEGKIKLSEKGEPLTEEAETQKLTDNWTDWVGYSSIWGFSTENNEKIIERVIKTSSFRKTDIILDFFLGSGTTTAVAHKLGRKWIGIEMGEHFYTVVLPRMKKVLAYDKSGISKEKEVQEHYNENKAGGFFKYYELEQYEEALANTVYENHDLLIIGDKEPYEQYVFMKDEKMLRALEIDYAKDQVKVNLSKLYPNIDIAETLSNLTGKWIKKIEQDKVYFEGGTVVDIQNLDYKLIKPLIWWE